LVTIALTEVEDPSQYGVAKLEGNKILKFIEKPKKEEAPSNLINSGLYIIEPEVIDMISDGFVMLERAVFPKLAENGKLFGYPFLGQWFDTGNMERYKKALKEWKGLS
jgi:NDP-sugar pyrophosphorylase family protein